MNATERREAVAFLETIHRIVEYAKSREQMPPPSRAQAAIIAQLVGHMLDAIRQDGPSGSQPAA